jgi:hypothetical protein
MESEVFKVKETQDIRWPDVLVQIIHKRNIGRYLIKKSEELAKVKVQRRELD